MNKDKTGSILALTTEFYTEHTARRKQKEKFDRIVLLFEKIKGKNYYMSLSAGDMEDSHGQGECVENINPFVIEFIGSVLAEYGGDFEKRLTDLEKNFSKRMTAIIKGGDNEKD